MSLTRPADLPVWATAGSVTVPSSGKQATGWVLNESPAHDYFNWHQNLTYEWLDHFDRKLNLEKQKVKTIDFVTGISDVTGLATSMPSNRTYVSIDNTASNTFQVDLNKFFGTVIGSQNVRIDEISMRVKNTTGDVAFVLDRYDPHSSTGNSFGPGVSLLETAATTGTSTVFSPVTLAMSRILDLDTYAYRLVVGVFNQVASGDIWLLSATIKYTEIEVQ